MEILVHNALHVLEHSFVETIYLVPFLFLAYLAMEWLEHKTGERTQKAIARAGAAGPVVGSVLGVVPQCGFSAVAATLYAGRVITLGTLFAVFLSTSDEMLPIFLAEAVPAETILSIMGTKLVIGMIMGFIVDLVVTSKACESMNCANRTTVAVTMIALLVSRLPSAPMSITTTWSIRTCTDPAGKGS